MRCIGIIIISSSFFCPKVTDYQLCHMAAVAKDHTIRLVDSQVPANDAPINDHTGRKLHPQLLLEVLL